MTHHHITSLRKGGPLLEQAVQAYHQGETLAFPCECGFVRSDPKGPWWLAATPPPDLDHDLRQVAEVFWPGPLRLHLRGDSGKEIWHIPAHPLARALLERTGPLRAGPDDGLADLRLEWKDPSLNLKASEVDTVTTPWRWLRSGFIPRREIEWLVGAQFVLSE